jgi:predicted DNA-binding transcriptional regulator YafY
MLQKLKSASTINSAELAEYLGTNVRNIREFRKELEAAGYTINQTRGRYGGYSLDDDSLLSLPDLNDEEIRLLSLIGPFLQASPEFMEAQEATAVLDKIIASTSHKPTDRSIEIYQKIPGRQLSPAEKENLTIIKDAIANHTVIDMDYQSKESGKPRRRKVDPQAVFCVQGSWYLVGWDHTHKDFRNYRISEYRMLSIHPTDEKFAPSSDFHLAAHIGKSSAFKGKLEQYHVLVAHEEEGVFLEAYWGEQLVKEENNAMRRKGYIEYSFFQDNSESLYTALFRFGGKVKLIGPEHAVSEFEKKLETQLALYTTPEALPRKRGEN